MDFIGKLFVGAKTVNFRRKTLTSTSLGNVASVDSVRSEHQAFRHLKLGGWVRLPA